MKRINAMTLASPDVFLSGNEGHPLDPEGYPLGGLRTGCQKSAKP